MQRIQNKKELRFYILSDRIMAGDYPKSFFALLKGYITSPPIISYLRHMRYCQYLKYKVGLFHKILFVYHNWRFQRLGLRLGFSIGYDVFGYGLLIPHYGTIVVNREERIGNYAVLHTSTCIGGGGKIIGDGLYLGTGASIMGKITLGNGVSVASGSLVNKSYEMDDILLTGMPAKVCKKRAIWYEEDGKPYNDRVKHIEMLRKKYEKEFNDDCL